MCTREFGWIHPVLKVGKHRLILNLTNDEAFTTQNGLKLEQQGIGFVPTKLDTLVVGFDEWSEVWTQWKLGRVPSSNDGAEISLWCQVSTTGNEGKLMHAWGAKHTGMMSKEVMGIMRKVGNFYRVEWNNPYISIVSAVLWVMPIRQPVPTNKLNHHVLAVRLFPSVHQTSMVLVIAATYLCQQWTFCDVSRELGQMRKLWLTSCVQEPIRFECLIRIS